MTYAPLSRLVAEEQRRREADEALRMRVTAVEERLAAQEAATEPPPAPEWWETVFKDDFAHGLSSFYLGTDNDTRPTTSADGTCTFYLPAGQDRSELAVHTPEWREGDRLLIKETFIVPVGFPYGVPGAHCTIQQFRQNTSAGSPLLSLELGDYGEGAGPGLYLHDKTRDDEYRFALAAPLFEGVPLVTEFEILTSRSSRGSYALRIPQRGAVLSAVNINTIPPEASSAYIKTGLYRAPTTKVSSLVIRDFSVRVPAA